jgi:hypothetical protein
MLATWTYKDSIGLHHRASGVVVAESADFVKVKINGSAPESEPIELPIAHVSIDRSIGSDAVSPDSIKSSYVMGPPSAGQLSKINRYVPAGAEPFTTEQVVSIPFIAADNLINRSIDKWDIASLKEMVRLAPGLPATIDHDWYGAEKEWGRIYSATFISTPEAPPEAIDRAGNKAKNTKIVKDEGYCAAIFEVFATVDKSIVQALYSGHSGNVSTGGFRFENYHCPICQTPFEDPLCPHVADDHWLTPEQRKDDRVAPWAVRVGLYDLGELSIVLIPNLPNAGIIR